MLRSDNDASSEASEDGRVVAYRDKFCGEQVNFHSRRLHRRRRNRLAAHRSCRQAPVVMQGKRIDSLCVQ